MNALSSRLLERLARCCAQPLAGVRLCVGFSGGLDSSVLLHALHTLRGDHEIVLSAVHVHHGLSPEADAWAAHCAAVCEAWDVPLEVHRVQVSNSSGQGVEAAARAARHAVFAACDADWIVLAQHRDDQAETVLHHLLRGSGVTGAAGMSPCDPARRLVRPLLGEPRSALRDYALEHGLSWVEDGSNTDPRFTRNHLRLQVLPQLAERFPAAAANLARAAGHFREASDLLAAMAQEDWLRIQADPTHARTALAALDPARQRNLLRGLMLRAGEYPPSAARLEDWMRQLQGTGELRLAYGAQVLCAWRNAVWLEAAEAAAPSRVALRWQGEAVLAWGSGELRFAAAVGRDALRMSPEAGIELAGRRDGMRLRLHEDGPTHSLRKLCQARAIPTWMRDRLPVLWCGDDAVWVGGIGAAASYLCKDGELGWSVIWHP